jgi:membrane protein YdbS with pleckstrin-like domain
MRLVIATVLFAILFPLLTWMFNRKNFSWLGTAVAVVIYAAIMALFTYTGFLSHIPLPKM